VAQLGATPVFADVDAATFNLDPASAKEAIDAARQAGLSPRMIIAVDLFGQPADYSGLRELARARGLRLVADAAQSLGAASGERMAGTLADWTTTSFFPAKPLGCYGDGGAVFVDDEDKAALLKSLRVHGEGADKYDNVRVGLNSRLDTLQAAILLEKLRLFPGEIEARNRIAARYAERLPASVAAPQCAEGNSSVWAQYTVRFPDQAQREAARNACKQAGIPTAVYYDKPLHRQTGYAHYPAAPGGLAVCEELAATVLSLPMHPYLDEATQDRIIATVAAAAG
jgi:dTDP-4-amino-4,6-dideoxygalactose transaminase